MLIIVIKSFRMDHIQVNLRKLGVARGYNHDLKTNMGVVKVLCYETKSVCDITIYNYYY